MDVSSGSKIGAAGGNEIRLFSWFSGLTMKHVTLKKIKTMEVSSVLEDLYDLYDPPTKSGPSSLHRISVQF
jgi:hypothetical protein